MQNNYVQSKIVPFNNLSKIKEQSRILGILLFNKKKPRLSNISNSIPLLETQMRQRNDRDVAEVFITNSNVQYQSVGDWKFGMTNGILFGALSFESKDGLLKDDTEETYTTLFKALNRFGHTQLLRIWNFVPHINQIDANDMERYQAFCYGRSIAFAKAFSNMEIRLPAATGIGSLSNHVGIALLAQKQTHTVLHLENPNQTPAYYYPKKYGPLSPSFARATSMLTDRQDFHYLFLAGTSSVVGFKSVFHGNIKKQTATTLKNLKILISANNLRSYGLRKGYTLKDLDSIKVYIRNNEDFEIVRKMCSHAFSKDASIIYNLADVCRSDLDVEIEAMITKPYDQPTNQPITTLMDQFVNQVHKDPQKIAYIVLDELGKEKEKISFAALHHQVMLRAACFQQKFAKEKYAILIYPNSIDFITSYFGCVFAGLIAIPIPYDEMEPIEQTVERITKIQQDIQTSIIVLSVKETITTLENQFENTEKQAIQCYAIEALIDRTRPFYEFTEHKADDTITILYTSGSIADPKGVLLSNKNVLENASGCANGWGFTPDSIAVSWLPHFHSFGLVFNIIIPMCKGTTSIIMSPNAFIRQPELWLKAISKYSATHSAGATFGYDHCVNHVGDGEKINLSSWQVGLIAAESIRYETYKNFTEKFKAVGLSELTFCPVYGLSETGPITSKDYTFAPKFTKKPELGFTKTLTSVGKPLGNAKIICVDPESRHEQKEESIGEIWIAGDAVTKGYWNNEEQNQKLFNQTLPQYPHYRFFRTGDLGFIKNNELYITGRIKEVIIVRGKKYYPDDIEWTIKKNISALNLPSAVFSIIRNELEKIILVQELEVSLSEKDYRQTVRKILQTISDSHGLQIYGIAFVEKGNIPKTRSGKIQRKLCCNHYERKELKILYHFQQGIPLFDGVNNDKNEEGNSILQRLIQDILPAELNCDPSWIKEASTFRELGLDSIQYIKISKCIETEFNIPMSPTMLFKYTNIEQLADYLFSQSKNVESTLSSPSVQHDLVSKNSCQNGVKDVAIIGMSCHFPGSISDPTVFWQNMIQQKDNISYIADSRQMIAADLHGAYSFGPNTSFPQWGGFIDDVDRFDASFFNISPREAECMDPQQRKLLELTYNVIEDSGYNPHQLAGQNIGLFIGVHNNDYAELLSRYPALIESYGAYLDTGLHMSLISNRPSRWFDFHGPSEIINTACSSSLVAIHHAVESIRKGESAQAIAGGINLILTPRVFLACQKAGMLSSDGRCRSFDEKANGIVRAEGCGAIMLKPLHQAEKDKDFIYGVIKGMAINHDGQSDSLRAPNLNAQKQLIQSAYQTAGLDPETISYIETHGTGTSLGDPIEIQALEEAFRSLNPNLPKGYCGIGTVKTNIGHCESAAGIAGLIKVLLSMSYRTLPGLLHFKELNPYIKLEDSPFYIVAQKQAWPRLEDTNGNAVPRRAGISSFGIGGANAHIILEEYSPPDTVQADSTPISHIETAIIPLSAKSKESLLASIRQLRLYLKQSLSEEHQLRMDLSSIAYTLQVGREAMQERVVILVNDIPELIQKLAAFEKDQTNIRNCWSGSIKVAKELLAILEDGEDSTELIQKWITNNKWEKLARYWLHGGKINWDLLYCDRKPCRISLPTYPFTKERYWIPADRGQRTEHRMGMSKLHPLLHINTSDLSEQRFSSTFTGNEFFLADHVVQGQKVLPGVAHLEMIREAVAQAAGTKNGDQTQVNLKNVVWAQPVTVNGQSTQVHISLFPEDNGAIIYEVYQEIEDDQAESIIFSQGYAQIGDAIEAGRLDIPALQASCNHQILSAEQCYEAFKSTGLDYGPGFQGLEQVYVGEDQVLAKLALPASVSDIQDRFILNPSIMDAALQASIGLTHGNGNFSPILLYTLEELEILGPCTPKMWAFITPCESSASSNKIFKIDIKLCSNQGRVIVNMHGVEFSEEQLFKNLSLVEKPVIPKLVKKIPLLKKPEDVKKKPTRISLSNQLIPSKKPSTLPLPKKRLLIDLDSINDTFNKTPKPVEMSFKESTVELYDYGEGVFGIKIDDASNNNLLSETIILALEQSFHTLQKQRSIKVILLMGGDQWFLSDGTTEKEMFFTRRVPLLTLKCDAPVIAVMKGQCNGLGWLISALCDLMICSENSSYQYFAQESTWTHSEEELALFKERFGNDFAHDLIISAKSYLGKELHEKGLWIQVLPKDEIDHYALEMAYQLAKAPRKSLVLLKKHLSQNIAHCVNNLINSYTPISMDRIRPKPKEEAIWSINYWLNDEELIELPDFGESESVNINSDVVKFEVYNDAIVLVTLCDKENKNTFSKDLVQGIMNAFAQIRRNKYKVVILTGYGNYFACGGTKEGLLAIQDGRAKFTDTNIYSLALECDLPVIAAMQGHGIGAGWSMGMFCDFVIFSEESVYVSPYMKYGFTPGAGATLIFPHKFGQNLGREILFSSHEYKGDELRHRGMKMPVLPRSAVQGHALKLAHRLALTSREELIALKVKNCKALRDKLETIYAQELAMHEESFVGNKEVLKRIQYHFNEDIQEAEKTKIIPETPGIGVKETDETILATIRKTLGDTLADELHMSRDMVVDDIPFIDMGLDSITGVTWIRKINNEYGLAIEATKVYSHPTVFKLASYVMKEGKKQGQFQTNKKNEVLLSQAPKEKAPQLKPIRSSFGNEDIYPRLDSIRKGRVRDVIRNVKVKPSSDQEQKKLTQAIAVIGMAGQFPKSRTLDEFWNNLVQGRDCISEIPPMRWDINQYYDSDPKVAGKTYCKWMGVLEDIDQFDPLFFNISPREAEWMDPQQRLFLQNAWHCIEDSGYNPSQLSGSQCGVFIGCSVGDYGQSINIDRMNAKGFTGGATSILAARISYALNLQGPCLSIDTACSASLVAIATACDSLVLGNSDLALAGGVCVMVGPSLHIMTSKAGMLSADGHCFTFDQRANGFIPGEGVGVVLLKRLEDAVRDSDQIHGVIRGWGVNQDGKTNGITAPNQDSQTRLIKGIYERYPINPEHIQMIEAHGTATKLGDPIEVEGLKESFKDYTKQENYCALGSVKSNIGHLAAAAGVAGFIKVLLALRYKKIPPMVHFKTLNRHINLDKTPFYINTECKDWTVPKGQNRCAAISSFGFSGTNAHLVIEEYVQKTQSSELRVAPSGPYLIVLSAKTTEQLNSIVKNLKDYLNTSDSEASASPVLSDIAYTLQVGREAMEERLGLIINTMEELEEKLSAFLKGDRNIADGYRGQVKRNKDTLSAFTADEELQEAICKWIARGKYHKLLDLWVKGLVLDWSRLYGEHKPKRISLPTYPFAKERYWISANNRQQMNVGGQQRTVLHPLLHENTSTLSEQRFSSTLTGEEFFLRGHQVEGQKVLPGVAYLEMARAAVAQAAEVNGDSDSTVIRLQQVVWAQPVVVNSHRKTLHIGLFPEEDGRIAYEIYSEREDRKEDSDSLVHSQGVATFESLDQRPTLNLSELQSRINRRSHDTKQIYEEFKTLGIEYDPAHEAIEELFTGDGEVLAKMALPSSVSATQAEFGLHPSLLDAALQASIVLSQEPLSKPALPISLESLDCFGPSAESLWAWVRVQDGGSEATRKLDIDLCDEVGRVCVHLKELAHSAEDGLEASPARRGILLAQPVWKVAALESDAETIAYSAHHILLCGFGVIHAEVQTYLPKATITSLAESPTLIQVEEFSSAALSVFEIVQAQLQAKPQDQVLIQVVVPNQGPAGLYRALSGLLQTAQLENPKLIGQVIILELDALANTVCKRLEADARQPSVHNIRYENGQRLIAGFGEITNVPTSVAHSPWRSDGVYLITGGAGGLGLIVAKAIAENASRPILILTGRSPLDEAKQRQLEMLKSQGANAAYRQVDVTDPSAVVELIEWIQTDNGRLTGIVHSAGVIKDAFIIKKSRAAFAGVLAPKVTGTLNLDQATQGLDLDVFILFSSGAGVLGNVGQSDYATANAFMDAFAHYRNDLVALGQRHGQTVSINWPLWVEGGMGVDEATEELMQSTMGLEPLETYAGVKAMHQSLASGASQVMVMSGDLEKIQGYLFAKPYINPIPTNKSNKVAVDPARLQEKTLNKLKGLLSETTQLPVSKIDDEESWEHYGLDSIMITQLNQKLSVFFGEIPKTLFFEYPNLKTLTVLLISDYPQACMDWTGLSEGALARVQKTSDQSVLKGQFPELGSMKGARHSSRQPIGKNNQSYDREAIAIIGLSGRYPQADTLDVYWENLKSGKNCITEIPAERWPLDGFFEADPQEAVAQGKSYSKWGGFLDGFADFDPLFFYISPREAQNIDPQERLFIESCWATLEDAGYTKTELADRHQGCIGIFAGITKTGYALYGPELWRQKKNIHPHTSFSSVANRISYLLDLQGPSMPIDTMCSSSLTAIHEACEHIHRGECEVAIAGGVNLYLHPYSYIGLCAQQMLSTDGQCKSFGRGGNGFVPGEGVGTVLLKPLSKAEHDQDHIYAVIRGTGINHGGKTHGYTVPNPTAQGRLIRRVLDKVKLNARALSYIEAHGTGTKLGDPIEITGLQHAFAGDTQDKQYCAIGSVKSNIGHLEAAAGIAGITKLILQLQHKQLVPSLHSEELNPNIDFAGTPFEVNQALRQWPAPTIAGKCYPRIAGISSFGAGGANAHVIVEEYVPKPENSEPRVEIKQTAPYLIVLSARTTAQLNTLAKNLRDYLGSTGGYETASPGLSDIAYTLQVGREAMEERLGLIVNTKEELEEKLSTFLKGDRNIADGYRGQVKGNKDTLSVFTADEDLQRAIDAWIDKGKYHKLLDLWVKGLVLDWSRLYGEHKPRRISLPTYPFAKERYWIETTNFAATSRGTKDERANVLHPLLHQNTSDLSEQRFTSIFTGEEFFLTDHVVQGQKVLPGVAYLEMARAAVEQATGTKNGDQTQVSLKNVVWAQPIMVNGQSTQVHIGLLPEDDGTIGYEVYQESEDDQAELVVFSQGYAQIGDAIEAQQLDIPALQASCNQRILSDEQCYKAYKSTGLEYGPGFQGLEQVYVGGDQVLAKLALPASVSDTKDQFMLHPSIMDATLQASIGLVNGSDNHKPMLPFALDELEILGKCTANMWALVKPSQGYQAEARLKKLDIDLCDKDGQICARLKGFTSRLVEEVGQTNPSAIGTLLVEPQWKAQDLSIDVTEQGYSQHHVILCDRPKITQQQIKARLKDVQCLILESKNKDIAQSYKSYTVQIFEVIQTLIKTKSKEHVLIQVVVPNEGDGQLLSGITGFLKTAQIENPNLICQLIETDTNDNVDDILAKLTENRISPYDAHIRYKNNQRYVVSWQEVKTLPENVTIPWHHQGVYLITGGAGGLGLIFAEEIVRQVKEPTLILTGRSTLSEAKQAQLKDLEKEGARVIYQQVDVNDKKATNQLVKHILQEYDKLSGIIHAAGVIHDNFILKKTKVEMEEVLAPKVTGLVNLDRASQDMSLDFFVLFSSGAGALGNIGQSDYAAANAFMDVYAAYRNRLVKANQRHGQTLSINWPLWQEGGMHVDEAIEQEMQQSGMMALSSTDGIQALYQSFVIRQDQVMVIAGNIKQLQIGLSAPLTASKKLDTSLSKAQVDTLSFEDETMREQAIQYFKRLLSSVIKLPASRIEADAPMEKYGIDSIMVMNLTNQLEKTFGSLSKTLFFEYQSIKELTAYFLESFQDQMIQLLNIGKEPEAQATLSGKATAPVVLKSPKRSRFAIQRNRSLPEQPSQIQDIAIIGMAGRYPQAKDINTFWQNLCEGKDCITEIPKERWDHSLYFDEDKDKLGKTYCKWGGFIDDVDKFDPLFFNISPREAEIMDPQERLFLETVWNLIENVGLTRKEIKRRYQGRVGVYVGVMYQQYHAFDSDINIESIVSTASYNSIANRVSHFFDFQGPSLAIDTACSSSAIAIHMACESLKKRESKIAIAGGVNLSIHPKKYIGLSLSKIIGSHPHSRSFGKGDGYIPAEGVGAVLLKPLIRAIEDQDDILAVIKSTTTNHGGYTYGFTVPNLNAQANLIKENIQKAKIDPRSISYVESAANGSALGDPIELNALNKAFRKFTQDKQFCPIGSVKTNIGHAEAASGISQITKVILQLQHHKIVPSIKADPLNPNLTFDNTPFYLQRKLTKWKRPVLIINGKELKFPRRATVSSFGAGGSNVHLILEEYVPKDNNKSLTPVTTKKPYIIILSAKNEERLNIYAAELLAFINRKDIRHSLVEIAYTLQIGREAMDYRLAFLVDSIDALKEKLYGFVNGQDNIETLYHSKAYGHEDTFEIFTADEDIEKTIDAWIAKRKYSKLLVLWVKGINIDWTKLYGDSKPRRISLPTYPFEKRRCWLVNMNNISEYYDNELNKPETLQEKSFSPSSAVRETIVELTGYQLSDLDENTPLSQLGLNSLTNTRLLAMINDRLSLQLQLADLAENNTTKRLISLIEKETIEAQKKYNTTAVNPSSKTLSNQAKSIKDQPPKLSTKFQELILLNDVQHGQPVFWIHGGLGGVEIYQELAEQSQRPFYGIQARGWMTDRSPLQGIQAMASYYVKIIQSIQQEGPYDLGGYSLGGMIAYEIMRLLQEFDKTNFTLVMLDTYDSAALKKLGRSLKRKSVFLSSLNLILQSILPQDSKKPWEILIRNDEVDPNQEDDPFLYLLISMAKKRGLKQDEKQLKTMIQQMANVQLAYNEEQFSILPLIAPQRANCYYFHNKKGIFFGEFKPYFSFSEGNDSFKDIKCYQQWEKEIPNFHLVDVDSSNHMEMLSGSKAKNKIFDFCKKLYSDEGVSKEYVESIKAKAE